MNVLEVGKARLSLKLPFKLEVRDAKEKCRSC